MVKIKKNSLKTILIKNILGIIVFFAIIFIVGDYVKNNKKEDKNITLTELVNDINTEKISSIKNINDKIEIIYKDETKKLIITMKYWKK